MEDTISISCQTDAAICWGPGHYYLPGEKKMCFIHHSYIYVRIGTWKHSFPTTAATSVGAGEHGNLANNAFPAEWPT